MGYSSWISLHRSSLTFMARVWRWNIYIYRNSPSYIYCL